MLKLNLVSKEKKVNEYKLLDNKFVLAIFPNLHRSSWKAAHHCKMTLRAKSSE